MFKKLVLVMLAVVLMAGTAVAGPGPRFLKLSSFTTTTPYTVSLAVIGKQTNKAYYPTIVAIKSTDAVNIKLNTTDTGYYDGDFSEGALGYDADEEVEETGEIPADEWCYFYLGPYKDLSIDEASSATIYIRCEYGPGVY